jgi:hypothetical protein
MKDAIVRLLSSMKFWTTFLGIVTAIGAKYGFKVDPEVYYSIVGLFGLLLGAQGLTDHGKEAAKIAAANPVAPTTTVVDNSTTVTTKEEVK